MNSKNLIYVLTVAEERSFSKAAKKLYVAQPSLSQRIHSIEEEIGAKLFDRSTVPLTLTYAGERYVTAAKELLNIEKNLQLEIDDIGENKQGRITLGISSLWGQWILPIVFPEFKKKFPNMELEIFEGTFEKLNISLMEGKTDLIVSSQLEPQQPLIYIHVLEDELLLASPSPVSIIHPTYSGVNSLPTVNLQKLSTQDFILLTPEQGLRKTTDQIFKWYGINPNIILETKNIQTALKLTAKGIGHTIILESNIKYFTLENDVSYYRFDRGNFKHKMYICYRKNSYLSKALIELINIIIQAFSTPPIE
ncbi:hypothetical protein A8L34_12600 [Bacillus sp. FJAT-27264]|uniref:LysR family transcriptional regulator n=1 Tax=Paenibacillus sp. (strain DSM 101736 / FJAT-27264) TaxID=1850362 RepID=UPI000807CE68|nr:LysR family transcriptional regulator [Bacillus sp. FJAT-27264]OBZ14743.1 hypothetical protein A8L34_12600 [Bacillus sp. FJAT-27264]